MKDEPVTIVDRDVLKVLSADTRMDILKMLSKGDRTPSFIGKKLGKKSSTIVEHLDVLMKADLVKKIESPGKKWVFYTLTERGKGIVSSKSRRLIIILATSLFALLGSLASFVMHISQQTSLIRRIGQFGTDDKLMQVPEAINVTTTTVREFIPPTNQPYLYLTILLFVISTIGFIIYFYKRLKEVKP
jgi:DNA-binding transcriptional ArsR family regulator